MEADIELNAVADDSVVDHANNPPVGQRTCTGSKVLTLQTEGQQPVQRRTVAGWQSSSTAI